MIKIPHYLLSYLLGWYRQNFQLWLEVFFFFVLLSWELTKSVNIWRQSHVKISNFLKKYWWILVTKGYFPSKKGWQEINKKILEICSLNQQQFFWNLLNSQEGKKFIKLTWDFNLALLPFNSRFSACNLSRSSFDFL